MTASSTARFPKTFDSILVFVAEVAGDAAEEAPDSPKDKETPAKLKHNNLRTLIREIRGDSRTDCR